MDLMKLPNDPAPEVLTDKGAEQFLSGLIPNSQQNGEQNNNRDTIDNPSR